MKFDLILTNPPFQDAEKRGKTPHKLWIDFTLTTFERLLVEGGILCQVSPSSFGSPSSRVLELMKRHQTKFLRIQHHNYFPEVASTFADYAIMKEDNDSSPTRMTVGSNSFLMKLDDSVQYLPIDICEISSEIHRKVMFGNHGRLPVEWDYVTCHNVLSKRDGSVSRERSAENRYPVLHTNKQIWWSRNRQQFADCRKVMWSRSGYTLPFYDEGKLGTTDMGYFVRVDSDEEGLNLAKNLNSRLMKYILRTAKWSGFGNERVFATLPNLPRHHELSEREFIDYFGLTEEEWEYVCHGVG